MIRTGLIGWTPALREVFTELASIVRHTSTKRTTAVESDFVWTNRDGQPYTTDGSKAMWTKIMADWLAAEPGRVKFNFHDLRALRHGNDRGWREPGDTLESGYDQTRL